MNDRIKQLAKEAGVTIDGMGFGEGDVEGFAKLIIQDCIQVCLDEHDPQNLNYKPSVKFAEAIKMKFGLPR